MTRKNYYRTYSNSNYSKLYYPISKPEPVNEKTGNFSVAPYYIQTTNHKPFLFEYFDHSTGKVETKLLDWIYVKEHVVRRFGWKEELDENTGEIKKVRTGHFYLISYQDIAKY